MLAVAINLMLVLLVLLALAIVPLTRVMAGWDYTPPTVQPKEDIVNTLLVPPAEVVDRFGMPNVPAERQGERLRTLFNVTWSKDMAIQQEKRILELEKRVEHLYQVLKLEYEDGTTVRKVPEEEPEVPEVVE